MRVSNKKISVSNSIIILSIKRANPLKQMSVKERSVQRSFERRLILSKVVIALTQAQSKSCRNDRAELKN